MTRIERIRTVMAGGIPDRIPVMIHNFLMAAREAGVTMAQFRSSADIMAKTMIDACVRYDTDGILVDVDTALLASACGAVVTYPEDIAAVTKFLDLAKQQKTVPDTVREHYWSLPATAEDCLMCGHCEPNCPFGVNIRENMRQAREIFRR